MLYSVYQYRHQDLQSLSKKKKQVCCISVPIPMNTHVHACPLTKNKENICAYAHTPTHSICTHTEFVLHTPTHTICTHTHTYARARIQTYTHRPRSVCPSRRHRTASTPHPPLFPPGVYVCVLVCGCVCVVVQFRKNTSNVFSIHRMCSL